MSTGIKRIFLGWDEHVLEAVASHISGSFQKDNLDLTGKLLIVPTSQAIIRLKEALAVKASANKQAVIGARIVTPSFLFTPRNPARPIATDTAALTTWISVLKKCKPDVLSPIFPYGLKSSRTESLLKFAEIISKVRADLSDNIISISDVLSNHAALLAEADRWQAMSAVEQLYLKELESHGLLDPVQAKIDEARAPSIAGDIGEMILCCTPEISGLAVNALKVVSERLPVSVLIHAPASLEASFDDYGCPVPEKWKDSEIDIPEWRDRIHLETTPSSQALRVAEILNVNTRKHGPDDVAIGVPDRDIIPYMQDELDAKSIPAYDPQDINCSELPVFLLISKIAELVETSSYHSLSSLIRTPDFLRYIELEHKVDSAEVLMQMDEFRNRHLPEYLGSIEHLQKMVPPALTEAIKAVKHLCGEFSNEKPADFWRNTLARIYSSRQLSTKDSADKLFKSAAEQISDVLSHLEDCQERLGRMEFNRLFLYMASSLQIRRSRDGEKIDLNGWLELHWNDAPLMIITGMNEDFVPGVRLSDMFLPNTLRRSLGLSDDSRILARDIYLLKSISESRRKSGLLYLIAGKFAADGSPLKPSRLMFRCSLKELSERAKLMFERPRELIAKPPAMPSFKFDPSLIHISRDIRTSKRISVTSFKDYLECPFRFYLRQIAQMEEVTDDVDAMDPASFGSLLHETLGTAGANGELNELNDPAKLSAVLCAQVERNFMDNYGERLPAAVMIALNSAKERLKTASHVQTGLISAGWTVLPEMIEQSFRLEVGGYTISGKIDRIDYNPGTKTLRVIDYKTGTFDSRKSLFAICSKAVKDDEVGKDYRHFRREGKDYIWKDLQLPIYYHMVKNSPLMRKFPVDNIELAYFTLPKAISETGIILWEKQREADSEAVLDIALKCCEKVVGLIDGGVFWPPTDKIQYDDFESLFIYDLKDSWVMKKQK